jgi:hypothetical protein
MSLPRHFAHAVTVVTLSMTSGEALHAQNVGVEGDVFSQSSAIGLYVSRGLYGQDSPTRVRYLPYTHEVSFSSWRLRGTLPVLEIDGPGNVLIDVGNVGGRNSAMVSERGIGDATVSATYELPVFAENLPFFDITVDLKLPLADERKGLGTGRPDAGAQLDAYFPLGPVNMFASVGYRYRHRSPVYEQLNDSVNLSLGVSGSVSDVLQAGLIYDFREAASAFSGDTHELIPYLSWSVSPAWSLMVYLVAGSTADSADSAVGVQFTHQHRQ